jgi:Trypsin-co-occurring domain 1
MTTYVEYRLEGDGTLLVQVDEPTDAATKAADVSGNVIIKAEKMFKDALISVRQSVAILRRELTELQADDIEVTFGIKTVGELGLFAVCKAGGEINYEVKVRWSNSEKKE